MAVKRAGKDVEPPKVDHVRIGGLMRCCRESISDLYPEGPGLVAREGQELQCKFSESKNHRMRFRDGAWEWDDGEPLRVAPVAEPA